jgi:CBS domain-containing protein
MPAALPAKMTLARFTGRIATVKTDETLEQAARAMRDRRVGCLIVTQAGHPIGVITDRDMVLRAVAEGKDPRVARVGDFATYDPITVSAGDGFETAVERMRVHGIRRLPIVDASGQVVGIVTADDLLAVLGGELGAVCEAIQGSSDSTDSR